MENWRKQRRAACQSLRASRRNILKNVSSGYASSLGGVETRETPLRHCVPLRWVEPTTSATAKALPALRARRGQTAREQKLKQTTTWAEPREHELYSPLRITPPATIPAERHDERHPMAPTDVRFQLVSTQELSRKDPCRKIAIGACEPAHEGRSQVQGPPRLSCSRGLATPPQHFEEGPAVPSLVPSSKTAR